MTGGRNWKQDISSPSLMMTFVHGRLSLCKIGIRTLYRLYSTCSLPPPPYRILFFGTDNISLPTLKTLHQNPHVVSHLEVVCPPDRPQGRTLDLAPVPVKEWALQEGLLVHQPPPQPRHLRQWTVPTPTLPRSSSFSSQSSFDVAVVVSFGYFLPPHVLDAFPVAAINMHPSLLPRYRGPAPIQHALLNGDEETGVSVIELHRSQFDAGRVLSQVRMAIDRDAVFTEVSAALATLGAHEILHILADLPQRWENATPQTSEGVTSAPKLKKEDGRICFADCNAESVYRLWRAVGESGGVFTFFRGKRILLRRLHPITPDIIARMSGNDMENVSAGTVRFLRKEGSLCIRCREGWLAVTELVVEGGRPVCATDFANGFGLRRGMTKWEE